MSAANPDPMEKSMVSVRVVANAGGGSPLPCGVRGVVASERPGLLEQTTREWMKAQRDLGVYNPTPY
jgi:hypothetical protein